MENCKLTIRLFFCIGLMSGAVVFPAAAQQYRVYRPEPSDKKEQLQPDMRERPRVQLYGQGVTMWQQMRGQQGKKLAGNFMGGSVGLSGRVWGNLYVGAEWTMLRVADKTTDIVSSLKYQRGMGIVRYVLTPDIDPQVYLLLGLGKEKFQTRLQLQTKLYRDTRTVGLFGLGVKIPVCDFVTFNGEYRLVGARNEVRNVFMKSNKVGQELRAGIAVGF